MILVLSAFSKYGVPASEVLIGIQEHIRNLIYSDSFKENHPIEINDEQLKLFKAEMLNWDRRDLFRLNQIIIDVSAVIRKSDDPYLLLEMTALKLLEMDKSIYIDQLLSDKDFLENNYSPQIPDRVDKKNENEVKNQGVEERAKDKKKSNSESGNIDENAYSGLENDGENIVNQKVNFDNINSKWEQVLDSINRMRPSVGSIIEDFVPSTMMDDLLVLEPKTGQGFNEKVLERGIPIIEKEIENMFDMKIKVKFITNDIEKNKPESETDNNTKSKQADDKVFDKIVDLFDGEIIH